ncbi:TPA: UDP-N-acetylmuramoyl-L-alanine--D-glutamate ligase [bacterium]|nr:UDP-N-acetylmuramoyl-L-alanine--D-glutamate ligase [bacterium]
MLNLKDKNVVVLGLGKSGLSSCQLLSLLGANVIVLDEKNRDELRGEINRLPEGIIVHYGEKIKEIPPCSLVVASPGFPLEHPWMKDAHNKGIPLIGEIELGWQFLSHQPVIAITGTNGKSTTVTLIGEILKNGGKNPVVCGNIDIPLTSVIPSIKKDNIIVLEVSSFQLETIVEFRADISIFLNFAPNHLDRYLAIEDYIKAKAKIFENQTEDDIMLINADFPVVLNISRRSKAKVFLFSVKERLKEGLFIRNGMITARFSEKEETIMDISEIKLPGLHNLENILASVLVSLLLRVDIEAIKNTIRNFSGLPHRIQPIATISNIMFVDDSKATNVSSCIAAIMSFDRPIILLAGGKDKREDYTRLVPYLKERVKKLVLFGESADIISGMTSGAVETHKVSGIEEAVNLAYALAEEDDIVLLSPCCSSFDQFKDYKERGEFFVKCVYNLKSRLNGRGKVTSSV